MLPSPEPGSVIAGRYRLVREIGRGGMGVVLEAENLGTGRRVAIKWLHPSLASHPEAIQRLLREATATCRIRHPNVVDVYDVLREDDAVYLVMEYLEGEPLSALLARGDTPTHQLIGLLLAAMQGVAEAHRLGVIHRDVHPANIFLARQSHAPGPVPKVLDFGISKIGGGDGPSLTRSGTTLGTPRYISYEQLCNASDVDRRTDVYSFGVILYEAIAGRVPFEGDSFTALAMKIAHATPTPLEQLQPAVPARLAGIVARAMARDRDDRIADLETLIGELEPFATELAFGGRTSDAERSRPLTPAQVAREPPTSHPRLSPPSLLEGAPVPSEPGTLPQLRESASPDARQGDAATRRTSTKLTVGLAAAALLVAIVLWLSGGGTGDPFAQQAGLDGASRPPPVPKVQPVTASVTKPEPAPAPPPPGPTTIGRATPELADPVVQPRVQDGPQDAARDAQAPAPLPRNGRRQVPPANDGRASIRDHARAPDDKSRAGHAYEEDFR
jgi:eukaryotic-like serine/threonine-protein kinase